MTASWFFLFTLNYDARSTTHQDILYLVFGRSFRCYCHAILKHLYYTIITVDASDEVVYTRSHNLRLKPGIFTFLLKLLRRTLRRGNGFVIGIVKQCAVRY